MSYLDQLRAAEISERPTCPSVESVETPNKAGLDTLDTAPPGPFQNFEADSAHHVWLVSLPAGERFASRCTPPATRAEVLLWHPTATSLEPEDDSEVLVETEPLVDILADIGTAPASRSAVVCCTCRHWRRDTVGDGSGLGSCAVNATASREQGSLWPHSSHRCRFHSGVTQ